MLFLKCWRKIFGPIFKELLKFLPKKFSICSQIYGFGIRDPRSGIRKKPISDPRSRGQKGTGSRIPDPQHCFLQEVLVIQPFDGWGQQAAHGGDQQFVKLYLNLKIFQWWKYVGFFHLHISYQTNFFKCGLKTCFFLNYTDPSDPDLPHSFKQCYES